MEKLQKLAIILLLLAALVPAYYVNRWLQQLIRPRASLGQLFLYILACFVLVFIYSFLLVWLISQLFPVPKR